MINTTAAFKTSIKASARRIKAKLILPGTTIEQVDLIELDSYLSDEDDLIIGTANMDVMKIEISDDPLNPFSYNFDGKEIDVNLGIELTGSSYEYHSLGKFTVEKSDRKDNKIYLDLVDSMFKADKPYISNLMYPKTLHQILLSAAAQAGLTVETPVYTNQSYIVNEEPVYEDVTCRQVFAYIAELAGGFARVNRNGSLEIITLATSPVKNIDGDQYITWKQSESAPGSIDHLIVKNGSEAATAGTGTNIYTVVDNLFVQNPADVVDNLFAVLSTINYKAGEIHWIGDFSLDLGDKITVDGEAAYFINRKLKYSGGLRETLKAPGRSNIERDSTGKPNTNLQIRDIKTKIKIISGEIEQVIEDTVNKTEYQQTIEGFSQRVTNVEGSIDGVKAWTIQIFSTNGGVFKNDQINTTLIARVYKGMDDITDTLDANRFRWTRVSDDLISDIAWNAANFGGKKQITVTSEDVNQRATFNVTIIEEE